VLVSREEQLARLRAEYAACAADRRGHVALVGGTVGAGKTALLEEFAAGVTAAGGPVLRAAGSVAERDVYFGVLTQLFQSARPGRAERVRDLLADPAFAVPLPEPGAEPPPCLRPTEHHRAEVLQGLFAALAGPATDGRLALVVDDVQHADLASLHGLLYLVRRLRHLPVMVVLAETTLLRPTHPQFRAELLSQPHFSRLTLPPLSGRALAGLAAAGGLDRDAARREAERCLQLTGGSPLLARALLAERAGAADTGAFEQAVLGSLYRHEPEVRRVAHALAVLDRPAPAELLADVLRVTPELAARTRRLLEGSGLVVADRLRHPRIVRAVLTDLPPEDRRGLHRRAAAVLHDHGAEPALVATHLVESGRCDGWAVPVLREAAVHALAAGRPDVAAACLRLVDRTGLTPAERAAVAALDLDARWQLNPLAATAQLNELQAAGTPGPLLAAVPYLLWQGRAEEAAAAVTRADGDAGAVDADRLATARLLVALSHPDQPVPPPGPGMPPPSADPALPAIALLAEALRPGPGADVGTEAEQLVARHHAEDRPTGPLAAALTALLCAGHPDRVLSWTEVLLDRPAARHAPAWRAVLRTLRAEAALRLGDLEEAEQQARTALQELPLPAWGVLLAAPLATLVGRATAVGDLAAADRWLAHPLPAGTFRTPAGLLYLAARGRHHLAAGRPHLARDDLRLCGTLMVGWGMDCSGLAPWRLELARVHLRLGERAEATALLEEQRTAADPRTRGRALRLLAGTLPPDRRRMLLSDAVDLLRAGGDRLELARALGDTAQLLERVGHPARARLLQQQAYRLAVECGADVLARRLLGQQPAGLGAPGEDEPDDGLSEAERRVASLAARGHTNRQISGELYITVSTVEQHLTRVYRKLKVKRRSDLPTRLAAAPEPPRVGVS
jgi:DNA-binding CsgD family transcriptional regulator